MERRAFFQALIAGGAPVKVRPESKNRRAHHKDDLVYCGPMRIPERVASAVETSPSLAQTTCHKLVMRYTDGFGWAWRFRSPVPAHRLMVGEIVRTPEGAYRVHLFSAADPIRAAGVQEPDQIAFHKGYEVVHLISPPSPPPQLPPPPALSSLSSPSWKYEGPSAKDIMAGAEETPGPEMGS